MRCADRVLARMHRVERVDAIFGMVIMRSEGAVQGFPPA